MRRRDVLAQGGATVTSVVLGGSAAMAQSGFFVPPEEDKHERTFMQWPVNRRVYRDSGFLEETQTTIAEIANAIADFEPVTMLAAAEDHGQARAQLSSNVELWDIPTEDLWCRDAGPIFLVDDAGGMAVNHIQFIGWGNKQVHRRDGQIA
ncbi:MAG: agmatine deiminase family protein, partial [Pseudomonadota bacterium]